MQNYTFYFLRPCTIIYIDFGLDFLRVPEKPIPTSRGKCQALPNKVVVDGITVHFEKDPVRMKCPECNEQITTTTKSTPGVIGEFLLNLFFTVM